jgi:16S rRNA processing protein RimM
VGDREAAQALRGLWVSADRRALQPLPAGEYYWCELVGCRVEDQAGRPIGTVREIWETGAHDVLVVEGEDGRRRLLPAAEAFLKEVDVAGRRIAIDVIEGLLDPS